jgi:hypothetical protein
MILIHSQVQSQCLAKTNFKRCSRHGEKIAMETGKVKGAETGGELAWTAQFFTCSLERRLAF